MGFLYQAIKRATGVPIEVEVEVAEPVLNPSDQQDVAAPAKVLNQAEVLSRPRPDAEARSAKKLRQSFTMPHPEKLVATLSHPVLEPNIAAMEHCRVVRTRLWEIMRARKVRSLLITSGIEAEGKTLFAVNLAVALSQLEGIRVLLVDADLRKPSVASFLGMSPSKGLSSYLVEQDSFEDVCWQLNSRLDVVPTLALSENSAEQLSGSRMTAFLARAAGSYDVVLADSAPVLPIADTQVLAPLVDGALLVVRAHVTPFEQIGQTAKMLGPKLIGAVLNGAQGQPRSRYYSHYLGRSDKGK